MRPIKYRGKRKDNGEWAYGYYLVSLSGSHYIKAFYKGKGDITHPPKTSQLDHTVEHRVDPETVGQFTGLKDKNDKEIYEGNKVTTGDGYNYIVKWSEENGSWYFEGMEKNIYDETPAVMDYRTMKAVYLRYIEVINEGETK